MVRARGVFVVCLCSLVAFGCEGQRSETAPSAPVEPAPEVAAAVPGAVADAQASPLADALEIDAAVILDAPPALPTTGAWCGRTTCRTGEVCCNASCGTCTKPGGTCDLAICTAPTRCKTASDCRAAASYCGGCKCRAIGADAPDPACEGRRVSCVVNPCFDRAAVCRNGTCVLVRK